MASSSRKGIALIAFLQAQNCGMYVGSWRHPKASVDFSTPEYFQRLGKILEEGRFHLAFFADRLAMPDFNGEDYAQIVANGIRAITLDPTPVIMAIASVTKHIGLGATYSTTYYEPFHVARLFATLDLMTNGRVAWNIVTSLNGSEARNFGRDEHMAHDMRYHRADEFMEVVLGHWGTWDDEALILNKTTGQFADPNKVTALRYVGKHFRSQGPFTVPRSRQGHPVLLQAGQSGRGMSFAARWAELIFTHYPTLDIGRRQYKDMRAALVLEGRDPDKVRIVPAVSVIVAETTHEAEAKRRLVESLAKPIDGLAILSEVLNDNLSLRDYDAPISDNELAALSWHSFRDMVITRSGKRNPSVRDFVEISGRGTLRDIPTFVGTPSKIVDEMETWLEACDGFAIASTHIPGSYDDFVELVVPELQRRGLHKLEYSGSTLRDSLGLSRPTAIEARSAAETR